MADEFVKCIHCNDYKEVIKIERELGKETRFLECDHKSVLHKKFINENIRISDNVSIHTISNHKAKDD